MYIQEINAYFLSARAGWDSSLNWNFKTEIQTLFYGDEERISLRQIPWEGISYKYTFAENKSGLIKPLLINRLRSDYLVPYYFYGAEISSYDEGYEVDGVKISSVVFSAFDPNETVASFPYNGYMLFYKGQNDFVIKKIYPMYGNISSGSIRVAFENDGFDYTGWKACPLRIGKIVNSPQVETSASYSSVKIEYEIKEPVEISDLSIYSEKYNGIDLYRECLLLEGDTLGMTQFKDLAISGNELGIRAYLSNWDFSYKSFNLRKVLAGREKFSNFLKWCMSRVGAYSPFYAPAYTTDFRLVNLTTNTIVVENGNEEITEFAIFKKDGTFYIAKASSVLKTGSLITYSFEQPFDVEPVKVFYLVLLRFDTDSLGFDFSLGGLKVTSSIPVRSIR